MGEWPEFFFVGAPLVLAGVGLIFWQRRVDARAVAEDDVERRFLANRSRRRTQVAILIAIVGGLMIACGLFDPKDHLKLWWAMVMLILIFAMWIAVLALGDMMATRAVVGRKLGEVSVQRAVLEEELRRLKDQS